MLRRCLLVFVFLFAVSCFAQQGMGNDCTLAGTWYGGSVTAYQLTVFPSTPAGHYTIMFQGIYKAAPINSVITGEVAKNGKVYEGSMLSLVGDDSFVTQPPATQGHMPDLEVGWVSMEMTDCNTIKNTIPFFGTYFGAGIWTPGAPNWVANGKNPMIDEPDLDLLNIISGGAPIVETYHRLPNKVNPALLHK